MNSKSLVPFISLLLKWIGVVCSIHSTILQKAGYGHRTIKYLIEMQLYRIALDKYYFLVTTYIAFEHHSKIAQFKHNTIKLYTTSHQFEEEAFIMIPYPIRQ